MKTTSIFLLFILFISVSSVFIYKSFSSIHQGYIIIVNLNNESRITVDGKNATITYKFIHSSEKTPWIEIWTTNKTGFYVREICWRSGGAGHPSNPEDFNGNVRIIIQDGYYCAIGVDRFIGRRVIVDLGHAINASITIGNYTIEPPKDNTHYIVVLEISDYNIEYQMFARSHTYSSTYVILFQRSSYSL